MKSRFVLHPILVHRRSRQIFLVFFVLTTVVAVFLYQQFLTIVQSAGIDVTFGAPSRGKIVSLLVSKNFFISMSVLAVLLASALTAQFVVGPVKRIESWLKECQSGGHVGELRLRQRDKFERLGLLINQFREKYLS